MIKFLYSILLLAFISSNVYADEIVQKFKNPSFSGIGASAHWLTIENQEKSRRDEIEEALEAAARAAQREEDNSTLAKFIRNLESRIYAQLSKQLVENMFSNEDAASYGSFVLEGNTVTYQRTTCEAGMEGCTVGGDVIILTITDEQGSTTTITIPIGTGGF